MFAFLVCVLTALLQEAKSEATAGKDVVKPHNCTATPSSSTAVLLTWEFPTRNGTTSKPANYTIHYRPLYAKRGNFTILHAGRRSSYLVENLDVTTYYDFRIVRSDKAGNKERCKVLAKTLRDALLSLPVHTEPRQGNNTGLRIKWSAINLPDADLTYRLFLEWHFKGKLAVYLLYEGKRTSGFIKGELPTPYLLYVSVVVKKLDHEAANIVTHPTEKAMIPRTSAAPSDASKSSNKTFSLTISIDTLDSHLARISWNGAFQRSHVIYQARCRAGNHVIDIVTSNTTVLFTGLNQLTTYTITVWAKALDGMSPDVTSEIRLTTPDKDECTDLVHACSKNSECVNTRGSYLCRCRFGWIGDGKNCIDDSTDIKFCDEHNYLSITWMKTPQEQTALAPCPAQSRGIARRNCFRAAEGGPQWGVPDLSQCISDEMATIAQQLNDPNPEFTDIAKQLADVTAIVAHEQSPLQTGDLRLAVDVIEKIAQRGFDDVNTYPPKLRGKKARNIAQAVVESSSNILHNNTLEAWTFMPKDWISSEASKLLKGMDVFSLNLAKASSSVSRGAFLTEAPNVVLGAMSTGEAASVDQWLPLRNKSEDSVSASSVFLPGSVVKLQQKENQNETQFVTFVSYRNLRALMQPDDVEEFKNRPKTEEEVGRIESDVLSVSLHPLNINSFKEPVTLILRNTQENGEEQASCVFWNMNGSRGFWSGEGCQVTSRNKSHTTCQCFHLTSFAVLMRVKDIHQSTVMEQHAFALGLISYIGISISIVALCLSFLTFVFLRFRNSRNRYFIHANLALSLGLAETLFLLGISKTANKIVCKTIAITLHYLFLVSFSWMALEGVILYLMLVKIFRRKARPGRDKLVFLLCGWGLPAIVVAASAALFHEGYGTREFCWLSFQRHFTWAFVGPVLFVCMFNFICLGRTFMVMSSRGSMKKSDSSLQKIRYWSKGCALLSCLLGLTWVVGVFVVNEDTIFMAYLFNIFNTLQGLLIFLFHCIGDEKVRAEYLRLIRCQSRSDTYAAAQPWWSKSDSNNPSRASEKIRRSTLPSNVEIPKVSASSLMEQRATLLPGAEYVALRESLTRPVKRMQGIIEDCQEIDEGMQLESQSNSQVTESLTHMPSSSKSSRVQCEQIKEEDTPKAEAGETGLTCSCEQLSLPNLPDVIQNECQDTDGSSDDHKL